MTDEPWECRVRVDPRVATALGVSVEEVKAMSLRELSDRAHDAGYDWSVTTNKSSRADGALTIRMDAPGFLRDPA